MQKKKRLVRILRIITPFVAIACFMIFTPMSWDIVSIWASPLPDTVQEQADAACKHGLDGIIVYIDQSGKEPAFYSAGWKNKSTQEPADPHGLFKIASISKLYIASASAKLVNIKSLSLDDTLADYLPELAGRIEYADQITLRMMLQHRSGIPDFIDQEEFDWFAPHTDDEETLEMVLDKTADFKPDARSHYSNTNYLLIGRILDNVLGYSHSQYIDEEILAPLGLTNTYASFKQVNLRDVANGYWYQNDYDCKQIGFTIPGGSMIATAQDVGVFLRALNDGSLLNEDEQAIYSSIYEYGHTGWLPGYYSIARYHEDIDTVVVQFVNTTGSNTIWLSDIVYNRIVKILHAQ